MKKIIITLSTAVLAPFLFSSCGGGGSASSQDTANNLSAYDDTATSADADTLLRLINDERNRRGLHPFTLDDRLNKCASAYAKHMSDNNHFKHEGLDGSTFDQRIMAAGIPDVPMAENIGSRAEPKSQFQQWYNSSVHRANMVRDNLHLAGLGRAGKYWCLVLAANE